MEEVIKNIPFLKLKLNHFATLDISVYIEHLKALEFLFTTNRYTRQFLKQYFTIFKNAFENEGL